MIMRHSRVMNYLSCLQKYNQGISIINALLDIDFNAIHSNESLILDILTKIETDGTKIARSILDSHISTNTYISNCILTLFSAGMALYLMGMALLLIAVPNIAWIINLSGFLIVFGLGFVYYYKTPI
ncbi:MAG TPA: hypothetical protein VHD33_03000 [Legionellaceae bacterium]|nr:hypothetical protein [Legionellaceae bacterium]